MHSCANVTQLLLLQADGQAEVGGKRQAHLLRQDEPHKVPVGHGALAAAGVPQNPGREQAVQDGSGQPAIAVALQVLPAQAKVVVAIQLPEGGVNDVKMLVGVEVRCLSSAGRA